MAFAVEQQDNIDGVTVEAVHGVYTSRAFPFAVLHVTCQLCLGFWGV